MRGLPSGHWHCQDCGFEADSGLSGGGICGGDSSGVITIAFAPAIDISVAGVSLLHDQECVEILEQGKSGRQKQFVSSTCLLSRQVQY